MMYMGEIWLAVVALLAVVGWVISMVQRRKQK